MLERFEQFSAAISAIYRDIQKIEKSEMDRLGYKGAFAQYLVLLRRHPDGLAAAEICELCDRDKAAVSRVMAEMEDKGLVTRTGNAYRAKLTLTELGHDAADYVACRAEVAVLEAGKGLSDRDRTIFYEALACISTNLQTLSDQGLPEP